MFQSLTLGNRTARRRRTKSTRDLYRFIWRVSSRSQILLALLAVGVLLLDLVPLELQRRIVNGALHDQKVSLLVELCILYATVALIQGATKFALNLYQSAVGERVNRRLRLAAGQAVLAERAHDQADGKEGVGISIIVSEVESVGGFVGTSVSEGVLHGGVLVSVFGYLLVIQPWMALIALGLFGPQLLFVPLLQFAINRRTATRIKVLRALSVDIVKEAADKAPARVEQTFERDVRRVYSLNMQIFRRKFGMNFLMNLLNHSAIAASLLVGGLFVIRGETDVGTVVAFISGLSRVNDPWGDLVNYFRDLTNAGVKYKLIASAIGEDQLNSDASTH
ncbi:MAG: ABC transporter transmembrane domain-containing protein [Pseudomonadota bacterium]